MKLNSKLFESIRFSPEKEKKKAKPTERSCQWDGCSAAGTHRAPVGRDQEGEYFFFCFEHVKDYNKNYNYFSGLQDNDVARFQKEALTGHRPTWRFGSNANGDTGGAAADFSPFRSGRAGYFKATGNPMNSFNDDDASPTQPKRHLKPLQAKALETLGLETNVTSDDIKARYKLLVKQHHPDANGGDRSSEDRLRDVLQAYRLLKQAGFC